MSSSAVFDLDAFLALPRLSGLTCAPDGGRLVTAATVPDRDGTALVTSLWELDGEGDRPARRLTWSREGERDPRFAPGGDLLFTSTRAGLEGDEAGEREPALWRLPARGGEAAPVAAPGAGVSAYGLARETGRVVLATGVHPGSDGWEADARREQARAERKVTARLYDSYPVRYWDAWHGPRARQLFVEVRGAQGGDGAQPAFAPLTSAQGFALETTAFDVAPDGGAVVTTWATDPTDPRDRSFDLVVLGLGDDGPGERRLLRSEPRVRHATPVWSPDGTRVACVRTRYGSPEAAPETTLLVVDVATGEWRDALAGFDRWPADPVWAPDSHALYFTADDDGHTLPFRVDLDDGTVERLAHSGAFTDLTPAPDGHALYALRSQLDEPPHPVALDPAGGGEPRRIPGPDPGGAAAPAAAAPRGHTIERVETTAADGARVPGWLLLPRAGDGPAPLVTFVHGGPLGTWTGWHWRWSPHLLLARGWAVLLPDPALSTGYGQAYVQRGWGRWGGEPYTDVMALVEATCARDDIDPERTALMGGSYGGYLANWVAGHTDRFDAIVTHASIWHLEAFHGVTDNGPWWENEFGDRYRDPERYLEWSPHRFVADISTPMLVIHGERDYRVPVSEGLALWTDLRRHGVESLYLHFPDENHWVLAPQHTRLWYETVLAFLDHHVLGKPWRRPELL